MELILALIVLIIVWCIAFMVGNKQGANRIVNQIKKDGGYYDMEYTSSVYPILDPTSSLNEVPKELLMGGDFDRTLHIAGIKEASFEKQKEWTDERKQKVETKTTLSMEDLLNSLNKEDLQLKAGIKQHTPNEEAIKVASKLISIEKDDNPLIEEKLKIEARRKEYERERQNQIKIDFEALNFSRISNEARKQITEIVKQDIENTVKVIEQNTNEIPIETNDTTGTIGSKPKTQTDYQREHSQADTDFMYKWIREKSGK
jgi:hypothetical protein